MKSVPGPGTYQPVPVDKHTTSRFRKFDPVHPLWKDAVQRKKDPGPNSYDLHLPTSKSALYTSIFRSNVKRNEIFMSDAPPPSTYRPRVNTFDGRSFSIKKPRSVVKKENVFNSYFGEEKEPVGPGAYNPENIPTTKAFTIKEASMDRFGHVKESYQKRKNVTIVPGPGTYQPAPL